MTRGFLLPRVVCHRLFRTAFTVLVLTLTARLLSAGTPVTASISTAAIRSRSEAPFPVEVQLDLTGAQMLEGSLEITLKNGNQTLLNYRSPELALTAGTQKIHLLLPPLKPGYNQEIEAQLRFLTKADSFDAGSSILTTPEMNERSFLICVSLPPGASGAASFEAWQSLRIENLKPKSGYARAIATTPVHLPASELPVSPLEFCAYDIVLLDGEGFGALHQKQLSALARWVEGGGSVCVLSDGQLQPYHLEFLNGLCDAGGTHPPFLLDDSGLLQTAEPGVQNFHAGLGRLVVAKKSDVNFQTRKWRAAAAFLWKIRADQLSAITRTGAWDDSRHQMEYQPKALGQHSSAFSTLMPKTIRLIPMPAIILILTLFVLAVGPLDYFALGAIKRRRWTWVLFPCVSGGVTLCTIGLANHYMGAVDYRNAFVFVDVGRNGRVLRQTRYEVILTAREKQVTTDVRNSICVPVGNADARVDGPDCRYEGQIPTRYNIGQHILQWSPRINRTLSFEPCEVPPGIEWERFRFSHDAKIGKAATVFAAKTKGNIVVFHKSDSRGNEGISPDFLQELCTGRGRSDVDPNNPSGIFSLLSQVSPNGGSNMEDLPLLDPSDPDQWLVVVVVPQGPDIMVYRRLYYANE